LNRKRLGDCPLCGGKEHELVFRYAERPERETDFGIPPEQYEREFWRCERCGLMTGVMDLDPVELYEGAYVDATYSAKGVAETFERIMSLPPERSDNVQRVRRIEEELGRGGGRTLLDVGSGLGVFPARMKEAGWRCTALDPDPRAADHLRDEVGVEAVCADFMEAEDLGSFSLITLNKVLEHVPDPVRMLDRSRRFLASDGVVYVELPDGEAAAADPDGPDREEFFIEHLWAFSPRSLELLAQRARFAADRVERIREPSGKYTLFAFLRLAGDSEEEAEG
jgi:SAM-dependent methyltransferase